MPPTGNKKGRNPEITALLQHHTFKDGRYLIRDFMAVALAAQAEISQLPQST
jgi:hypothetical protein